jgi:hypothetical protein
MVTDATASVILCSISLAMVTYVWYRSQSPTKRHHIALGLVRSRRTKYLQYYHNPPIAVIVCYSDILNPQIKLRKHPTLLEDEIN